MKYLVKSIVRVAPTYGEYRRIVKVFKQIAVYVIPCVGVYGVATFYQLYAVKRTGGVKAHYSHSVVDKFCLAILRAVYLVRFLHVHHQLCLA